ncbi:vacuolar sorting-associated protein-like, putative [Trypanosoma equiperdum]|uniref:Vacuolar sorting-associated protein-like, putative n=4 Tax=Trypanozoon TaxID=39700 RepID=Q383S8_TRYB2|nr:vacuolar sorting-associated protein-like,putative [Trypanosoma brucei gambiense DAL972]XP_829065.1 vacuolar sorting-associated protein-like, putative [Trypanosoma brucei brucei TREU927]RHW68472.1 vacuolar sorting-associated protein-like [Trypanosoma brucei equiperdum]SCU72749.1 vacuolar sorting-associated protein-like, putative [Trypanosoma equiperdum]EAN79953.1 vacuolar sorting-associated protein-like, putative [Trypanosoma brucei brucei TREU927]CBH18005.1 vacuolar sorting-associated prote|eukprot:XP_011780269.1 vacuolar sorting-associated protein-like,putative [Trypanosoma brucei gambiense DAL972]
MLERERPQEKERGAGLFSRFFRKMDGCDVKIILDGKSESDVVRVHDPRDNTSERLYRYSCEEPVNGRVMLNPKGSYRHNGVDVMLLAYAVLPQASDHKVEFITQVKRFEPDTLQGATPLEFSFTVLKEHESYRGINARVMYVLRVVVHRPLKNVTEQMEFWVTRVDTVLSDTQPDALRHRSYFRETVFGPNSTTMDVGVTNMLHIEFMYDKRFFHLQERVLGKVTFKVTHMDIRYGEVGVVRKETVVPPLSESEAVNMETLQKFEIMDGTPIVGEVVPIRLYLNCIPNLTPTYKNVQDCVNVQYFLNLVLITADGKRFFKQQEIELYRRRGQEALTWTAWRQDDPGKGDGEAGETSH